MCRFAARRLLSPVLLCFLVTGGLAIQLRKRNLQPKSGQQVTLTLAGFASDSIRLLSAEGLDEFTQKNGIHVEFVPIWGASGDQLRVISRTLDHHFSTPDVYLIDLVWPATLEQHLLDLTPYLNQDARSQWPQLLQEGTIDGRVVSLPFYLNLGMLYYRTDLLQRYGYRHPPQTWNELARMAARIQHGERAAGHPHFWGYVWQGAAYEGLTCNALEWQSSFGGGTIMQRDGKISVNNPRTLEAFRMAAGWVGTISPPSVLSYTESDSLNVFRSGNAAFLRYWTGGYRTNLIARSAVRNRFGITLLPAGPHGRAQTVGGFQLAVSRYSEHPRQAAELVLFLTGKKLQQARAVYEGRLPTMPELFSDPKVLASVPAAQILRTAKRGTWVARPSRVAGDKYSAISKAYYETVHAILSRQRPPEKALQWLEAYLSGLQQYAGADDK